MTWMLRTLAGIVMLTSSIVSAQEFRGLWVDGFGRGFYNSNQVVKLVADCRKYNFNAVIVEMRARGDAFYHPHSPNGDVRHTFVGPTPEEFDPNHDALADVINQCHASSPRIQVHCWAVAQLVWADEKPPRDKNHVYNLHPEYLTKDALGQTFIGKGYYLDPGHPDACQWNHDVALDIVKHYDIDGFHWDYLRYPSQDSGFNETALARYNAEFNLHGQPATKNLQFCEWRRRQMTDFLRWVDADMLELNPELVISASVFANYQDAYGYRFQDWVKWNEEGLLDVCMPMDFSTNNLSVFNPRADFARKNEGSRVVYGGQGAYMNTKENTLAQLEYLKIKGFGGYCLYSYRSPSSNNDDQTFTYLKERHQSNWESAPILPWKMTKGIIKGTVTKKRTGDPCYNARIQLDEKPNKVLTEPHGKYAFFEVSSGMHDVKMIGDGGQSLKKTVQVIPGKVTTLDFSQTE